MDKQTTFAFILIGAIIILWLYLNTPTPPPPVQKPADTTSVDTTSKQEIDTLKNILPEITEKQDSLQYGRFYSSSTGTEDIITIENDLVIIELSSKGGNIRKYFLKKFNNWYSADDENDNSYKSKVQLINYTAGNAYDLAFVTSEGKAINTGELNFISDAKENYYNLSGSDSLTITYKLSSGQKESIQKVYSFSGNSYHIKSDIVLEGMNNLISNNSYDVLWNSGIRFVEENSVDEANYSNASLYYGDEQVIIDADDAEEKVEKDFNGRVDWIGAKNKYLAAIISPDNPAGVEGAYVEGFRKLFQNQGIKESYSVRLTLPFRNSDYEKNSFLLYIGPVDYDILKTYGRKLEAIVDFGSFLGLKFIVRPIAEYILLPLFNFL